MKWSARILAALFLLSTSSCATMLKGTTDQITVVSDPNGAEVTANDTNRGQTPVTFTVPSKEDLNIQVSKPGYQTFTAQNEASFRWGYSLWGLLSIIPFIVDLASGAAWGHDNLTVAAHLQPSSTAPATPAPAPSPVASGS